MRRLLVALALVAVAGAAHAAGKEAAAEKLLEEGSALFYAGDLTGARVKFAAAHEMFPDKAQPFRMLGLVDARLHRCAEAVSELEEFVKRIKPDDPRYLEAITVHDQCRDELGVKVGTVIVETKPAGAEVRLDEARVAAGVTPYRNQTVPAGTHVVHVRKAGAGEAARTIVLAPGATVHVEIPLGEKAAVVLAPPPPPAAAPVTAPATPPTENHRRLYWVLGIGVAALAVVALAVGLGVGLHHPSEFSTATMLPPITTP